MNEHLCTIITRSLMILYTIIFRIILHIIKFFFSLYIVTKKKKEKKHPQLLKINTK